jgi:hypothetical protein
MLAKPRTHRRRLGGAVAVLLTAAVGFVAAAAPAAYAAAEVSVTRQQEDVIDFPVAPDQCLNAGAGELILLNGTLNTVTALRIDAQGGFHVTLHANLAGMSGIGTTTGDVYRLTDTAGDFGGRLNVYFPPGSAVPRTVTQSGDVLFVSEGSGANLLVRGTFHLTIDATGAVTVSKAIFEESCVG